jgi:hypothetical protein
MAQVAIGFRAHTGWAVAVVLAGPPEAPAVVDRRRLDLTDPEVPRQAFHVAADLDAGAAEALVERATRTAEALAERAVRGLAGELWSAGHRLAGAGVVLGGGRRLGTLAQILASHAAMHAAEGELYREVLVHAAAACGLPVTGVPARDLDDRAAAVLGVPVADLRRRVTELGRAWGPPWAQDQKSAALVAWVALTLPPGAA